MAEQGWSAPSHCVRCGRQFPPIRTTSAASVLYCDYCIEAICETERLAAATRAQSSSGQGNGPA